MLDFRVNTTSTYELCFHGEKRQEARLEARATKRCTYSIHHGVPQLCTTGLTTSHLKVPYDSNRSNVSSLEGLSRHARVMVR